MYIYADESGHSGRMIFNDPPYYYQAAILATADVEPALLEVGKKFCQYHNIPRVHSNEMQPKTVIEFAEACLGVLGDFTWELVLAKIHKPYIATTKFVDTVFDSGENLTVPFLWYNHDFFRHSLCCLFDDVLTDRNKRAFWEAYLNEDFEGIKACIRNAKTYLSRYTKDKRMYSVALDALNFVLTYPDEITILAKGKKRYKPHTPNMVGFGVLIQATRNFAKKHTVTPIRFIHDRQSEFGPTMREYHRMFSNVELIESENGFPAMAEVTDIDLGEISLPASADYTALQVVDAFMWVLQRDFQEPNAIAIKKRLEGLSDDFEISRSMSEVIRFVSLQSMNGKELSTEDEKAGLKLHGEMEAIKRQRLQDFMMSKK